MIAYHRILKDAITYPSLKDLLLALRDAFTYHCLWYLLLALRAAITYPCLWYVLLALRAAITYHCLRNLLLALRDAITFPCLRYLLLALRDAITYPCLRYLLLASNSSIEPVKCHVYSHSIPIPFCWVDKQRRSCSSSVSRTIGETILTKSSKGHGWTQPVISMRSHVLSDLSQSGW